MQSNSIDKFCHIAKKRSIDNMESFSLLYDARKYGNCFSILRQELDSLVRMIFLLKIDDRSKRLHLMEQTIEGEKWSFRENGKKHIITDKDMVDVSDTLFGWAGYVYKFGCGFIHLSNLHNYLEEDPFSKLSLTDKRNIINFMHQYFLNNLTMSSTTADFIEYLPKIMEKISGNLHCYIQEIKDDKDLEI